MKSGFQEFVASNLVVDSHIGIDIGVGGHGKHDHDSKHVRHHDDVSKHVRHQEQDEHEHGHEHGQDVMDLVTDRNMNTTSMTSIHPSIQPSIPSPSHHIQPPTRGLATADVNDYAMGGRRSENHSELVLGRSDTLDHTTPTSTATAAFTKGAAYNAPDPANFLQSLNDHAATQLLNGSPQFGTQREEAATAADQSEETSLKAQNVVASTRQARVPSRPLMSRAKRDGGDSDINDVGGQRGQPADGGQRGQPADIDATIMKY